MKASLLIVDDDPVLSHALADRCRHWGHEVATAASGEEALGAAEKQSFDLIVLDLGLPGLSGLDVLERLKAADCTADVVVLTAHGSLDNAVEAVKRGAEDFLTKPADFDLLERAVDRCLERRRLAHLSAVLPGPEGAPVIGP